MMYSKRLVIIIIITCTVAYTAGYWMDHAYKKRWATLFFDKSDELIRGNNNYDIIFLGNSRVHFGINPYYVDSVTKLSSYNLGIGGADMEDIMLTSNIYLQQHPKPRLVILSLDMGGLTENETLKTRFHYLFYLDNDTISKYMNKAGFLTGLIKVFPFTKYSFFDEYNRTSLFLKGKQYPVFRHNIYKGFFNIHQYINKIEGDLYNNNTGSDRLSGTAITYFRKTLSMLKQKGISVVLLAPPEKISSKNRGTAFKLVADSIFTSISNEYQLKYLHFENDASYTDDYFVDDIHLNEPGTKIYSMQLADSIKSILY
ncbi:MAG: hypothetical protein ABI741_11260 [Ferruginibacter sp.]